jgi:hypothetical protein
MAVKVIHRKLGRHKAEGLAYKGYDEIHVDERMNKKPYMLVVIHELLHIYFPELSEKEVDRVSRKICNDLWKLKFRRIDG